MEQTVTNLMREEHQRLDKMLEKVEIALKNNSKVKERFDTFQWNLKKHFLAEEKGIFGLLNSIQGEDIPHVFDLMNVHSTMVELIVKIEQTLPKIKDKDIQNLKKILTNHSDFENKFFYPKLDKVLNPNVKQQIISRAKEIISN